MPSVDNALNAAKFCAKPTDAITSANSVALVTPINLMAAFAAGCVLVAPPTKPIAIGIQI